MQTVLQQSFPEEIRLCEGEAEITQSVAALIRSLGFDGFAFVQTFPESAPAAPAFRVVTDYPAEWQQRYLDRRFALVDPVLQTLSRQPRAFTWHRLAAAQRGSAQAQRVLDEAGSFGINGGLTIPLHEETQSLAGLTVVTASGPGQLEEARRACLASLPPLARLLQRLVITRQLAPQTPEPALLTPRQREVLSWTAKGKTSWEISRIMQRSEPTICYHIQHSIRKLNATNKCHAAVKAMQLGLLDV